ncbi:MAG: DNA repair protein RecN [Myxococcota bacterium]
MLRTLRISNFAVMEEAELELGPGLTVLTGETGAGKSILVDALGLLLGGRAAPELIRAGCDEATVEGVFVKSPLFATRLTKLGLSQQGEAEVCVRRVVSRSGRGRVYVDSSLVTVGVLAQLMRGLVDIAGQHEHMSLFEPARHRELVDRLEGVEAPLAAYRESCAVVAAIDAELAALGGDERQLASRAEFLRFQLEEIDRLAPKEGEDLALEEERRKLASVEKLRRSVLQAESLLSGQEGAALDVLSRALSLVTESVRIDGQLNAVLGTLTAAKAEADDAARGLSRYLGALEVDPARLSEVEERLDSLRRLCRKHAAPLEAVIALREELASELESLDHRRERVEALMASRAASDQELVERGLALTAARKKAGARFCAAASGVFKELAMNQAQLAVRIDGVDHLEFLFTANPGEPARPLAKVASGGEASRVLLALRHALSQSDDCQCYVLDEADAGVGGAVAEAVGRMMKAVSAHRQVLCITHLPQVAAFADVHWVVRKTYKKGRTRSWVERLRQGEQRERELARMLSGAEVTCEAVRAAQALVRSASKTRRFRSLAAERGVA